MSLRIGGHPALGSGHVGVPGWGVLGSQIPSSGTDGPAYLYPSITLPADADTEYLALSDAPINGLDASLDSAFEYNGIPGSFEFNVWENGVNIGSANLVFQIGTSASISEADTLESDSIVCDITVPELAVSATVTETDTNEIDTISAFVVNPSTPVQAYCTEIDTVEIDAINLQLPIRMNPRNVTYVSGASRSGYASPSSRGRRG